MERHIVNIQRVNIQRVNSPIIAKEQKNTKRTLAYVKMEAG